MLQVIIGLALVPFAIIGVLILVAGAWYIRWAIAATIALIVISGTLLIHANNVSTQRQNEANKVSYQTCVTTVNQNVTKLYGQAYHNGTATQAYLDQLNAASDTAKAQCSVRYPNY